MAPRIGVAGCGGRMGRLLIAEIAARDGMSLSGGIAPSAAGQDLGVLAGIGPIGILAAADDTSLLTQSDVVIDFTRPAASAALAARAAEAGVSLVIGTTGFGPAELAAIHAAAARVPIVLAANFSIGVNLLLALVEEAARVLGTEYDIEIAEMHHRHKLDAPSGTALALGAAAAAGRGRTLDELGVTARDGRRPDGAIGFASMRGGDVIGDHIVVFAGPGERLELGHKAADRRIFAAGAVRAAAWVEGRAPGLYGMRDVLTRLA